MHLSEAIHQAKKGNAILFAGAGFARGATNGFPADQNQLPTATDFARHLSEEAEVGDNYPLSTISQYYSTKFGEHALVAKLLDTFTVVSVADYHCTLASQPWRRIYTTNYDNCIELAALQSGVELTPITLDTPPTPAQRRCVHINGHISNLTINTIRDQIKLTHSSYSTDSFARSQWAQQLRQDMGAAKAIIFVGYSMADLDLARVLNESPDLRERTHFVTSTTNDPVQSQLLEPYGQVHPIGVQEFAEEMKNTEASPDFGDYELTWLTSYPSDIEPDLPNDLDSIELILKGVIRSKFVGSSLADPKVNYVVRRSELENIVLEINNGRQWHVVHSDLGNGKTVFKEELSYVLTRQGYKVYWDTDFELQKKDDIREVARSAEKFAILLDEDPDRFGTIELLRANDLQSGIVVLFVRSTLYQLGEKTYDDYLPEDYAEYDLNRLSDQDVSAFVELFNALGLWGDRAALTDYEKENLVKVECERSVAKLILSIFEHSEVGQRMVEEANAILKDDSNVSAVVLLSFILSRLGHLSHPTLLSEILGVDVWRMVRSEGFRKAGEFIRYENGIVRARSSIISTHLLRSAVRSERIIKRIELFVRNLEEKKRNHTMHHVFTELQRFPVLEGMIVSERKREIIIGYFQSIKDLEWCRRSPDFWLHYAMARLTFGDFDTSALYFRHAKDLAKGNQKKTTDVNNHFARLLLDSRIKTDSYSDYFKAFDAAHAILIHQMNRDDNRHYPYRQAKKYVEFISSRRDHLSPEETRRFIASCRQVKAAIRNLTGSISRSSEVVECSDEMDRAIEIAGYNIS